MKKQLFAILAAAAVLLPVSAAEDTRTIHLIQDDAREKMTTKIYNLQHLKASDLAIFVDGAARRYFANSKVRALNFAANKQQALIVTAPDRFMPYMDELIATLDRGTKRNEYNSGLYGIGFTWKVYYPKYRPATTLLLPADVMITCNGNTYAKNNTLWVKDDGDDVDYVLDWVKYFDRPVPQASVTLRYYMIRESTIRDIGIDYLAWKNGPGLNLLDMVYDSGHLAWDKALTAALDVGSSMSWAYGGIFTAPAFDMSFVRLLQQSGEAKVVATATANVICDQKVATLLLSPVYNNQIKNEDFASLVVASDIPADITVNIYQPTICFFTQDGDVNDMGWIPSTPEFYARNKGSMIFAYDLSDSEAVEANNLGAQIGNYFFTSCTHKTVDFGREQVLAHTTREHDVEQTTGVPFLCQLPVLKYIFGTTTTMHEKTHIFVTMEANLVHPEAVEAAK